MTNIPKLFVAIDQNDINSAKKIIEKLIFIMMLKKQLKMLM